MSYRFRRPTQDDLPAVTELVRALWRAEGDEGDPTLVRQHALPRRPTSTATGGWSRTRRDAWSRAAACARAIRTGCGRSAAFFPTTAAAGSAPSCATGSRSGRGSRRRTRPRGRRSGSAPTSAPGTRARSGSSSSAATSCSGTSGRWGSNWTRSRPSRSGPTGSGSSTRGAASTSGPSMRRPTRPSPTTGTTTRRPTTSGRRWMVESDNYDPSLWLLAWDGDEIAGFSLCDLDPGRGLGRRPRRPAPVAAARPRHRAPVRELPRDPRPWQAPREARAWTRRTRPARRKLYESVGMRVLNEFLAYRLIVR